MKHITPFFQSCQQSEVDAGGSWSIQKISNVHSMLQVKIDNSKNRNSESHHRILLSLPHTHRWLEHWCLRPTPLK